MLHFSKHRLVTFIETTLVGLIISKKMQVLNLWMLIVEGLAISASAQLICSETTSITVNASNFNLTSFDGYQVVIAPDQLQFYQLTPSYPFCFPESSDDTRVEFKFDSSDCFPIVEDDGDYLTYTYPVWAIFIENITNPILRYSNNCFNTTCIYPNEQNITSEYAVEPYISKNVFNSQTGQGEFSLELGLYAFANCSYTEPFPGPPPTVQVSDYVYVLITDDVTSYELILQAQSCWASPYENPYTNVTYPIIENGCAVQNTFDPLGAIEVIKNFNETIIFKFQSFVWTNFTAEDQKIYVHCTVTFCDLSSGEDCQPLNPCPFGRKKRDLSEKESHVISVGPMNINADLCHNRNGGCTDLCTMVNQEKMCSCFGRRILGDDMRSCFEIDEAERSSGEGWLIEEARLFAWLMGPVILILLLALYILNKKENGKM